MSEQELLPEFGPTDAARAVLVGMQADIERLYDAGSLDAAAYVELFDQAAAAEHALFPVRISAGGYPLLAPVYVRRLVACPTCAAEIGRRCIAHYGARVTNHAARQTAGQHAWRSSQAPVAPAPAVGDRCGACRLGLVTHEPSDPQCLQHADYLAARAGRPDPAFAVGDTVTRRRTPDPTGTIVEVTWRDGDHVNPISQWYFTTSWGSSYPAHELVASCGQTTVEAR